MKAAKSVLRGESSKKHRSAISLACKPPVAFPNGSTQVVKPIRQKLLAWYDVHRRELPWRDTGDPYRVWLSEMMLQQTQVATVIPYYERFTSQWPTVADLAAASLDEVLRLWAGLGYYARARNLYKAARMVVDEFGGTFPDNVEDLLRLPGVGRYSAGAIASIAFGKTASVVDGNVARVLARLFVIEEDVRAGAGRDKAWELADALVSPKRPGDFNQAVMELGATVCLPGESARCLTCPLRSECMAAEAGRAAELPVRRKKTRVLNETHVVVVVEWAGALLLVRRPEGGLWGGLWEMPSGVVEGSSPKQIRTKATATLEALGLGDVEISRSEFLRLKHQLTHRSIEFVCHKAAMNSKRKKATFPDNVTARWISPSEIGTLGLSTAMVRIVEALVENQSPLSQSQVAPAAMRASGRMRRMTGG